MADESVEEARRRWAAAMRESTERYRALLLEHNAPPGMIEELEYFERPLEVSASQPLLPRHTEHSTEASPCGELRKALNELRARFIDRAAIHATPGLGQEAMAFPHVDQANHHEALMAEIERLERAMMAAGCPI